MARLRERDEVSVATLEQELQTHRLGARSLWPSFLELLSRVLEAGLLVACGVEQTRLGPQISFVELSLQGADMELATRAFRRAFSRGGPHTVGMAARLQRAVEASGQAVGLTLGHALQNVMWAGRESEIHLVAARIAAKPLGARERTILRRIGPALRQRLELDHRLSLAPMHQAAIQACLDTLEVPAAIIDSLGRILQANPIAWDRGAQDPAGFGALLARAISEPSTEFELTPLRKQRSAYFLVVGKKPGPDVQPLLVAAAKAWSLTPRETQTLGLLAEGLSSLSISAQLHCAERTVEVHVGRLLAKSKSSNRLQLIAKFWSGEDFKQPRGATS